MDTLLSSSGCISQARPSGSHGHLFLFKFLGRGQDLLVQLWGEFLYQGQMQRTHSVGDGKRF